MSLFYTDLFIIEWIQFFQFQIGKQQSTKDDRKVVTMDASGRILFKGEDIGNVLGYLSFELNILKRTVYPTLILYIPIWKKHYRHTTVTERSMSQCAFTGLDVFPQNKFKITVKTCWFENIFYVRKSLKLILSLIGSQCNFQILLKIWFICYHSNTLPI